MTSHAHGDEKMVGGTYINGVDSHGSHTQLTEQEFNGTDCHWFTQSVNMPTNTSVAVQSRMYTAAIRTAHHTRAHDASPLR